MMICATGTEGISREGGDDAIIDKRLWACTETSNVTWIFVYIELIG